MNTSLQYKLRRAMEQTRTDYHAETLKRVGVCIASFLAAESGGESCVHPEMFVIELPIQDHEAARACFDMLELLRAIDD